MKCAKFLRVPCFREHLQWLLLKVSGFRPATLCKKRLWQGCFSVNFAKVLGISFLLTPVNFEKFFRTLLYRAHPRNCYFHVQVAEFQPPDIVKNYSTGAFQAIYIRSRTSHSKAFIYLNSMRNKLHFSQCTDFRVHEDVCSARLCTHKLCTRVVVVHWSKNINSNAPLPDCIQNTDKNQPSLSYVGCRYI